MPNTSPETSNRKGREMSPDQVLLSQKAKPVGSSLERGRTHPTPQSFSDPAVVSQLPTDPPSRNFSQCPPQAERFSRLEEIRTAHCLSDNQ